MADKDKSQSGVIEGPNSGSYNGSNPPGGALKMPVKHYPSSTKMATNGKSNTIEGPGCEGKGGYHK